MQDLGSADSDQLYRHVTDTWLDICGTAPPLRTEVVRAFANAGSHGVKATLGAVSATARLRNGLHYLDFALAALAAAGVDHLYLMIDQLEDLATTRTITTAKRSREIGRIRDMLEGPPYANRVHFIFTFHMPRRTGSRNDSGKRIGCRRSRSRPATSHPWSCYAGSRTILRCLTCYACTWRNDAKDKVEDDLLPFDAGAIRVLRDVSDGRVGILLSRARELFDFAAQQGAPRITGEMASKFFAGAAASDLEPGWRRRQRAAGERHRRPSSSAPDDESHAA